MTSDRQFTFKGHYNSLPYGVCKLLDALICFATLGLRQGRFESEFVRWRTLRRIRRG